MSTDDREQQFERALARHLRDASPDSGCPDAETFAAYHEGTLTSEQTAHWKEHISTCARCQEALALVEHAEDVHAEEWQDQEVPVAAFPSFARPAVAMRAAAPQSAPEELAAKDTAAIEPVTVERARPRATWRWLVPIGALAACVIVWISLHEIKLQHSNATMTVQMARNQQPPAPQPVLPRAELQEQATDQLRKEATVSPSQDKSLKQKQAVAPPPKAAPRAQAIQGGVVGGVAGQISGEAAAALAPNEQAARSARMNDLPRPAAPVPSAAETVRSSDALAPSPPATTAGSGAGKAPAPGEKKELKPYSASQTVEVTAAAPAISPSASSDLAMLSNGAVNLLALAAADHRYIVAPGEKSAWRVGNAGSIERSTDHGKTWKTEKSGVAVDLVSGSATSDKTCWVVGKAGTILLSTDGGKHWKPIPSPIPGDLGGVHAIDASHASIWDVPNRNSYETNDGGATWNRIGNE